MSKRILFGAGAMIVLIVIYDIFVDEKRESGANAVSKKFDKLAAKITREYETKGVSPEAARKWGRATAAKVYREKESE